MPQVQPEVTTSPWQYLDIHPDQKEVAPITLLILRLIVDFAD